MSNLSIEKLKQAVSIKEEIAALESKLAAIFGGGKFATGTIPAKAIAAQKSNGRKAMSAAHRAKLAAAAKARWAAKKQGPVASTAPAPKAASAVKKFVKKY